MMVCMFLLTPPPLPTTTTLPADHWPLPTIHTTEHFAKAAGGVVRHALQQLEALGLVEKTNTEKGGRKITPEGQRQMDLVAASVKLTPFALLLE